MKKYPFMRCTRKNVVFGILSGVLLASCQVHRAVPVEHLNNGRGSALVYDARKAEGHSKIQPLAYVPSSQAAWAPIHIEPIISPVYEPTQPLGMHQTQNHLTSTVAVNAQHSPQADFHIVRRGESLYGIARQYGVHVKTLAQYNNLFAPYEIYPQQKLVLKKGYIPATHTIYTPPTQIAPVLQTTPVAEAHIQWAWPAAGHIIKSFNVGVSNGIEISGEPGRTIRSSADGVVLYSGNEVTGYGELVIIEHANGFMTTYAHNRRLFVKQGDQVKRGAKIAEMGSSESDRTKLHFEIRQGEKPVNPLAYLPKR